MSFGIIYFKGLIRRGTKQHSARGYKREVYELSSLTMLDDLLGERWYVRGINKTGDFCYIQPGSVKYYLKQCKQKVEYQMQADGAIHKYLFGGQCQLVFVTMAS